MLFSSVALADAPASSSVPETLAGVAGGSLLFKGFAAVIAGEGAGGSAMAETEGVVAGVSEADEVRGTE